MGAGASAEDKNQTSEEKPDTGKLKRSLSSNEEGETPVQADPPRGGIEEGEKPSSSADSAEETTRTSELRTEKPSAGKMKSVSALNSTNASNSEHNRPDGDDETQNDVQNVDAVRHADDDEDAAWEREKKQAAAAGSTNTQMDRNNNNDNSNHSGSLPPKNNTTNGKKNSVDESDAVSGAANGNGNNGVEGTNGSSTIVGTGVQQTPKKKKLLNGTNIEYRYPSGSVYIGAFKDGKLNGYGKYHYHPSGDSYEGEWQQDMKHGSGTYTYDCGDTYVGDWRLGKKHGKGEYRFMSGDRYIGGWREDKIHGYGIFHIAKNGNRFEGQWVDSYRHGHGTLFCGNGDVYEGNWTKGKEHDRGVLTYSNGNIYCGDWKQGQMDGKGIMVENGQKQVVEHIAGYCIARTPVHESAAVDPDWNPANEFYLQHLEKLKQKEKLGMVGSGPISEEVKEKIKRLEESNANWERKYKEVLRQKAAEGDDLVNGEGDAGLDSLSNAELKAKIKEYKAQLHFERTRAEEHEKGERKLEAELNELKFDVKEIEVLKQENESLKAMTNNGQGGRKMVPVEERDRLQRRIVELERDIMPALASDPAPDGKKSKADSEMKAQLQIMESEVKIAKAQKAELQKLRQENMDLLQLAQRAEQQVAEATKEAQHQRLRNQSLEQELSSVQQHTRAETGGEVKDLRQENVDLKHALIVSEEAIQKYKGRMRDFEDLSRKNQSLEVELQQMRNRLAVRDKTTDNKLDQLRLQNAEQARKLEEADVSGDVAQSAAFLPHDGDSAGLMAKIAEFEAQHKKDKKKAKKIQNERDEYFQKLNEQMTVSRRHANDAAVSALGKIVVYARRPSSVAPFNTLSVSADSTSILLREGDQPRHVDGVLPPDEQLSSPAVLLESTGGLRSVVGAVGRGQNVHLINFGPMRSGKTTWLKQKLAPLVFTELFSSLDRISGKWIQNVSVHTMR